jgi:ATP adenylyltransferase
MDRLWTPWRYQYISSGASRPTSCVLCELERTTEDGEAFILCRSASCFVLLNLYPYTTGHMMVVPQRHVPDLASATAEELHEIMRLAQQAQCALQTAYCPEGYNLGMNLGACAGAGVDGHLHLHVLPRWKGDTNFMSVASETRVLPETLAQTYRKLLPFFSPLQALR